MSYHTVFEIIHKSYQWGFPAFGLIFVFLGILFLKFYKLLIPKWKPSFLPSWKPKQAKMFGWVFTVFSSVWTVGVFASTWSSYHQAIQAYKEGRYSTVEGVVQEFVPMPYTGHAEESFKVNGVKFTYSDYEVTPGFNNTSSHGGPIRAGLKVRIGHLGNTILKLEVSDKT